MAEIINFKAYNTSIKKCVNETSHRFRLKALSEGKFVLSPVIIAVRNSKYFMMSFRSDAWDAIWLSTGRGVPMMNDDFDLGEEDDISMMLIMDEMDAEDEFMNRGSCRRGCLSAMIIMIVIPVPLIYLFMRIL